MSTAKKVFADPVNAGSEQIRAAAAELEAAHAEAVKRLADLEGTFNARSLEMLTQGNMKDARDLAAQVHQAKQDVELRRRAIAGASASLETAAREAERKAEEAQWERLDVKLESHAQAVKDLDSSIKAMGDAYRRAYSLADALWAECPRKPGSNRDLIPLIGLLSLENNVKLAINEATGGIYPGLGDVGVDLVGDCEIGHAHFQSRRPRPGLPANFTVRAEDLDERLGTGATLDSEGWRMPGAVRREAVRYEIAEVDWDAVEAAERAEAE